jgi:hypothetical protein
LSNNVRHVAVFASSSRAAERRCEGGLNARAPARHVRLRTALGIAVSLSTMLAAGALAASPVKGTTYRGSLGGALRAITISFRVSPGGTEVSGVALGKLPFYCAGSGPPAAPLRFDRTKISRSGTFTDLGREVIGGGPLQGKVAATVKITGSFAAGGVESGVIATDYGATGKACSGSSHYATRTALTPKRHAARSPARRRRAIA